LSGVSCLQIPGSEKILETVSGADRGNKLANLLKKTGLTKAAMSSFGEPELLDDLADHWNAGNHKEVCCRSSTDAASNCSATGVTKRYAADAGQMQLQIAVP